MASWAVSTLATVLIGTALFGGFVVVTPTVLDVAMVVLAASGSHMVMGLMESSD